MRHDCTKACDFQVCIAHHEEVEDEVRLLRIEIDSLMAEVYALRKRNGEYNHTPHGDRNGRSAY